MKPVGLIGSGMWILGLAVVAASLGWRLWRLRLTNGRPARASNQAWLDSGWLLFYLGVALAAGQPWARLTFAFLAAAWAVLAVSGRRAPVQESLERRR